MTAIHYNSGYGFRPLQNKTVLSFNYSEIEEISHGSSRGWDGQPLSWEKHDQIRSFLLKILPSRSPPDRKHCFKAPGWRVTPPQSWWTGSTTAATAWWRWTAASSPSPTSSSGSGPPSWSPFPRKMLNREFTGVLFDLEAQDYLNFVFKRTHGNYLKVLSDENQGGSKLVSIDSIFFTV